MQFPIAETEKQKNKTRVDFRVDEFYKLIVQKGLHVKWSQSAHCPCHQDTRQYGLDLRDVTDVDVKAGEHRHDCPVCRGSGVILHSPQIVRAICTSSAGEVKIGSFGQVRDEIINLTLLPEHLPSYGDHFKIENSVLIWREVKQKTASNVEALSHTIVERTLGLETGDLTLGVLYLHIADINGNAALNGERVQGVHFGITDGKIDWTKGTSPNPPALNTKYSVAYYTKPKYVIIEHPHTIRDTLLKNRTTLSVETPQELLVQAKAKLILS